MDKIKILGVGIDSITKAAALDFIDQRVKSRVKTFVATINPEFIMAAQTDPRFKDLLNQADLAVADGIGLLWAANFLAYKPKLNWPGFRQAEETIAAMYLGIGTLVSARRRNAVLPEQITGVDLSVDLAKLAARQHYSMFLLGAAPGVAEKAAANLQNQVLGLSIAGTFAGDGSVNGDGQTLKILSDHPAEIVLVAYGAPKQEFWIQRNFSQIPERVAIGVGGTFMYLSGQTRRAPTWVRRFGGEWLFRLVTQPWRWKRQLALARFIGQVIKTKWTIPPSNSSVKS